MRRAAIVLALSLGCAGFGPFGTATAPVTRDARPAARAKAHAFESAQFFYVAYELYRHVVSPIDGPRCAHYPTCSAYAILSVRRKGVLLGLLMTVDRLWMTGRSSILRALPTVRVHGVLRFYDPVSEVPLPHPLPHGAKR